MTAPPNETEERLRATVRSVLALREERAEITAEIKDVMKDARERGFETRKITEVCIWLERVEKHGRDEMIAAEEIFDLYREVAEGRSAAPNAEIKDKVLAEIFATQKEEPKQSKRALAAQTAATLAAAAKKARGE